MKIEEKYMSRCLELSRRGTRMAMPNPCVGAAVVYKNKIIGEGFTSPFGGKHAEVNAIESVENKTLLADSTLYVSLEPCAHHGKTPPCVDLIIKSKIPNVVIGLLDPHSKVNGQGIKKLKNAGISVRIGVLEDKCYDSNKRFFTFQIKKRPYIILVWGQTKNGFIDKSKLDNAKQSNTSNFKAKAMINKWRSEEMALLTATNLTLSNSIADNENFTKPVLWKVILDKNLKKREDYNIDNSDINILIFNEVKEEVKDRVIFKKVNFKELHYELLSSLFELNILSIIIENNDKLIKLLLANDLWDEARVICGDKTYRFGTKAPIIRNNIEANIVSDNSISFFYNSDLINGY